MEQLVDPNQLEEIIEGGSRVRAALAADVGTRKGPLLVEN